VSELYILLSTNDGLVLELLATPVLAVDAPEGVVTLGSLAAGCSLISMHAIKNEENANTIIAFIFFISAFSQCVETIMPLR
jgi:hypothetical protein